MAAEKAPVNSLAFRNRQKSALLRQFRCSVTRSANGFEGVANWARHRWNRRCKRDVRACIGRPAHREIDAVVFEPRRQKVGCETIEPEAALARTNTVDIFGVYVDPQKHRAASSCSGTWDVAGGARAPVYRFRIWPYQHDEGPNPAYTSANSGKTCEGLPPGPSEAASRSSVGNAATLVRAHLDIGEAFLDERETGSAVSITVIYT